MSGGIRELSSPDWQPIDTAPKDGTKIRVNHSKSVEGYDCIGFWHQEDERWAAANAFISADRRLYWQPDLWRPLGPQSGRQAEAKHLLEAAKHLNSAVAGYNFGIEAVAESGLLSPANAEAVRKFKFEPGSERESMLAEVRAEERERCALVAERFLAAGQIIDGQFIAGPNTPRAIASAIRGAK